MWSTVWSLVGLVGLFISFAGAAILVFKAVKSKEEIIEEAAVRVGVGNFGSQEYKDSLLRKPSAQAALVQSRVAKWGLGIIASGFLLQFSSALALFIFP